jgi:hypothetical protein
VTSGGPDRAALRDEIAKVGFRRDPLAAEHADRRHYGLNIAVAWPLPAEVEAAYGEFAQRVGALHPELYVYPFSMTHVTVLTAVNFKSYPDPTEVQMRDIDRVAVELGQFLAGSSGDLRAFSLETGRPALASRAAFVPMTNPTGEIAKVRERALAFCRAEGGILAHASAPSAIHSTVVRFREPPPDAIAFADAFDAIASGVDFGRIAIGRLLVTLETKPYMRDGRVVRSVELSS